MDFFNTCKKVSIVCTHVRIQRETGGPDPPFKNHKNIGFLSNTGPDPLKSQSYKASIQCWAIIGPPAKRNLNGVTLAGRYDGPLLMLFGSSSPLIKKSWTPSGKTFWIRAWHQYYMNNRLSSAVMFCSVRVQLG